MTKRLTRGALRKLTQASSLNEKMQSAICTSSRCNAFSIIDRIWYNSCELPCFSMCRLRGRWQSWALSPFRRLPDCMIGP